MRRRLTFLLAAVLTVAACGGGATPSPSVSPSSASPEPSTVVSQSPAPSEAASAAPGASAAPSTPAGGKTYTVKAGDTMIKIAKKFGITLTALQAANPSVVPTKMKIGSVLVIPPK